MADGKQATWGGRFSDGPSELMKWFGESVSFDKRLAPFDVNGSKAHSSMLEKVGLLSADECEDIHKGLDEILSEIEAGTFEWDAEHEDVHMNLEQALLAKTPAAAKLHAGRSRNDQIATDMRLFFKDACVKLGEALETVMKSLLGQARQNASVPIAGYTHLQRAQPVTVGHHLLAHVEAFARDRMRFFEVADHANVCPLGSGAIAGSTLPIDRYFVATELGFVDDQGEPRLTANGMDAVADRDIFVEFASACATCGLHISRLAEDFSRDLDHRNGRGDCSFRLELSITIVDRPASGAGGWRLAVAVARLVGVERCLRTDSAGSPCPIGPVVVPSSAWICSRRSAPTLGSVFSRGASGDSSP